MPHGSGGRKALTPGMMELLEAAVKARLNIIISGGTGSGKTTLLNALSSFISPSERIVTIEDAAELQLKQPHVVRLETRPPNIEGQGAIRQRELLINSLRMRPDRIIIGEVRGEEALDMLQAMNTGHEGSLTTVHANTPRDADLAPGSDGVDGQRQHAADLHPAADRLRRAPDRSGIALERRLAPGDEHHRSDGHGRRSGHAAGHFRFRETRARRRARCWAASRPPVSGQNSNEKLVSRRNPASR